MSSNEIAIAFDPEGQAIGLGDELELDPLVLREEQVVRRSANGAEFRIVIQRHDVHDLRLRCAHGVSRFPSESRLSGA